MSIVSLRDCTIARPKEVKAPIQFALSGHLRLAHSKLALIEDDAVRAWTGLKNRLPASVPGTTTPSLFGRLARAARLEERRVEVLQAPIGGLLKRALDITVASVALLLLIPVLAAIALAVKLCMGGDVVYKHRRVGFAGVPFDCLKFRTMVANGDEVLRRHLEKNAAAMDEWQRCRKLANDPRVTFLGRALRKTSLDELPQIINILRGEMSCVGPRPIVSEELKLYGDHSGEYFCARPGITGPWQVSGRSSISYDERIRLDVDYVQNWAFSRDLVIILRTIPAALKISQAS